MKQMYFPIYINLSDKQVLAIGNGEGIIDAVERFVGFAEHITVVAADPGEALARLEQEGKAVIYRKEYDREDLYGADFVVAQTGDAGLDKDIYAACKCLGISVHLCDDPKRCDFYFDGGMSGREEGAGPEEKDSTQCEDTQDKDFSVAEPRADEQQAGSSLADLQGNKRMQVRIYTDGAARGNPDGPGGYGTVLEYTDPQGNLHTRQFSQGYVKTTNNRMELMAAIVGLEALTKPCNVELYSDSKYLIDAFNKHWIEGWIKKGWKRGANEPVKNVSLWKRLLAAAQPHQVTFIWVKGHNGHPQNELCDQLATSAADSGELIEDDL